MSSLTKENIDFIIKDLHNRGLLLDGLKDEIIDHVCTSTEVAMQNGTRFMDAYTAVIKEFGSTEGLHETQDQTIRSENKNLKAMLQNYFTTAIRTLKKQRFFTLINVSGLAIGIASCLIILLYVQNELSYDKHFSDVHRIYRVEAEIKFGDNHLMLALCPAPMAEALTKDFAEIETSARFWNTGPVIFRRTEESFKESRSVFGDSSIFKIFDIPFIAGDPNTALKEPATMAISRRAADKYFPNEAALGQSLISSDGKQWKITGVYENIPTNTHFDFDFIRSLITVDYNRDPNWLSNNFSTYIKLGPNARPEVLESKLPTLVETYAAPQLKFALGNDFSLEKFMAQGNKLVYTLMPVTDIHLHSDRMGELTANSSMAYVYLFSIIAGFILAIACINFMNLSTARSANRAKEVGIRKVMGSLRSHLVRQFLTESILLSMLSFIIAIAIGWLTLPMFNALALKDLSIPFTSGIFWTLIVGAAVITGVFAGIYPSFFLSAFRPVNVLKGNMALGTRSGTVRGALVVFQFFISIVLVVGTIAVNRQLDFIQTKRIGFDKEQVIVVQNANALKAQLKSFKEEVEKDTHIKSGTVSDFLPVFGTGRSDNTYWAGGKTPTEESMVSTQTWEVDHDYIKTLDMKIKAGRDFSREFISDSSAVILNESAIKMFGFTGDPVGQKIVTFGGPNPDPSNYAFFTVVGIVEDFHYESMRQTIGPLGFFLDDSGSRASFRFEANNTQDVVKSIESTWKKFSPGLPFEYTFLDEDFGRMYSSEERLGEIFTVFAVLAIIIASLGLFALTAFTAEQRTKEIGIRKVLGASVSGIVILLSKEFGKLILISFVLAAPVAWYGINWWLEGYTYKTQIGVFVYLFAGFAAFAVAWLTMSFQSIRAALANPVKSLRSE
jgi:putative ABC transport system permease protein